MLQRASNFRHAVRISIPDRLWEAVTDHYQPLAEIAQLAGVSHSRTWVYLAEWEADGSVERQAFPGRTKHVYGYRRKATA